MRTRVLALALFVAGAAFATVARADASPTPAGTNIQNTASATYQDNAGTNYNVNSNTVSTTVQNAPALTIATNGLGTGTSSPSGQTSGALMIAPSQTVNDVYTLTNSGNGSGTFAITAGSGVTGTGNDNANASAVTYVLTYNSTTTSYTSVSALNTALASDAVAAGASITITVQYALAAAPANVPGDVTTSLGATIAYGSQGVGLQSVTSTAFTNTYDDAVKPDARLDLALASSQDGVTGNLTYTVSANNGSSGFSTQPLTALTTLGFPSAGVLVSMKVPQFNSAPLAFAGGYPAVSTNGTYYAGTSAAIYTTTSANGSSGWTALPANTLPPAGTTYIGVLVTGPASLKANPGSSSGNVPTPALTLTFTVKQPSGSGSGNAGSAVGIADSAMGNNATTEAMVGPGASSGTADGTGAAATTALVALLANTNASQLPSGASNTTSNQALGAATVAHGPVGAPSAIGSYDGVVAVSQANNFTAVSFTSTNAATNSSTDPLNPNGNTTAAGVSAINVPNQLQNTGNVNDTYTLTATAPAGFTVILYKDNGVGTPGSGTGGNGPNSSQPLGAATPGNSYTGTVTLASGSGAYTYWAVYTAPAGVQYFKRFDATIVAQGTGGTGDSATTHNELYSGFVALTKSVNVTAANCPGSPAPPAGTVCPGGTLAYSVVYRNVMAGPGTGATIPASAQLYTKPGTLVITENGTAAGNTWGTYSSGLNAPATDTTANSTFTSNVAGSTSFAVTVGGSSYQLAPGAQGTISFAVTVK